MIRLKRGLWDACGMRKRRLGKSCGSLLRDACGGKNVPVKTKLKKAAPLAVGALLISAVTISAVFMTGVVPNAVATTSIIATAIKQGRKGPSPL